MWSNFGGFRAADRSFPRGGTAVPDTVPRLDVDVVTEADVGDGLVVAGDTGSCESHAVLSAATTIAINEASDGSVGMPRRGGWSRSGLAPTVILLLA
ncbi:hypothetical protein GCM10025762_04300 [Haloechinothrix salitolerans]